MTEIRLRERLVGRDASEAFHGTLIVALAEWIGAVASSRGLARVALGGGCLANRVLAEGLIDALRARGLDPALPREVPANDGGVSFGQAAFALARLRAGDHWTEE
jgi:hydrogenase maturation protein HypF